MSISIKVSNSSENKYSFIKNIRESVNDKSSGKIIFAGTLNKEDEPIEKKKRQAQTKAYRVVKDAWDIDQSIADSIKEKQDYYFEQAKKKSEAFERLNGVKQNMQDLKESYKIDENSQEQKDLLLYEKQYDVLNGISNEFTDEEKARLQGLKGQPKTEYQTEALGLYGQRGEWKRQINSANLKMQDTVKDIESIKLEQLKSHPMSDAQKEAGDIMAASSKEIIGMIMDATKKQIDDSVKETKEKIEENEKKAKEEEERQERIKEYRALQEAIITGSKEAIDTAKAKRRINEANDIPLDGAWDENVSEKINRNVSQSLDDIKNSMKLLEADLKGIKINEEV